MMKKISYIFVLLISLFMVNVVAKANFECPQAGDYKFVFDDNGKLIEYYRERNAVGKFFLNDYVHYTISSEDRVSNMVVTDVSKCPKSGEYRITEGGYVGGSFKIFELTDSYYNRINNETPKQPEVPTIDTNVVLVCYSNSQGIGEYNYHFNKAGQLVKITTGTAVMTKEDVYKESFQINQDASFKVTNKSKCPTSAADVTITEVSEVTNRDVKRTVVNFTDAYYKKFETFEPEMGPNDTKCTYTDGTTYIFNSEGDMVYFYSKSNDLIAYNGDDKYSKFVMDSKYKQINQGVCPTRGQLSYRIDGKTVYIRLADSYYDGDTTSEPEGCSSYQTYSDCTSSKQFSCVWVDRSSGRISTSNSNGYCNVDNLQYIRCGDATDIPAYLPRIISFAINLLKIVTPIILVLTSAISLIKAITANKEDEMNKAKNSLVRRIAIAALIFFTITITQFVLDKVADDGTERNNISKCLNCLMNDSCGDTKYYKNSINGKYKCYLVKSKTEVSCD